MRPEDNRADDRCGNCGDENRSCRDIFRVAYEWMKLGRSCVREEFESGVKSFGRPDNGNSEDDPTPIRCGNLKEEAAGNHNGGGCGMNPCVMLTADHPPNASHRMAEAADAARKLKWPAFGCALRCGVVLHGVWLSGLRLILPPATNQQIRPVCCENVPRLLQSGIADSPEFRRLLLRNAGGSTTLPYRRKKKKILLCCARGVES